MVPINFKSKGEGFPIILIHGFCESAEIWDSFSSKISKGFKTIALDLPGFGSSKLQKPNISIHEVAQSLNEWVVENGFTDSLLIGHSLGGYVSLAMISQNPKLYAGLGLFHSTAMPDTADKKINRGKVIEFVKTNGVTKFIDSFIPGLFYSKDHKSIPFAHKIGSNTAESTFVAYMEAMRDRPSFEEVLTLSDVPILIIAGQNDSVIDVISLKEQSKLNDSIRFYSLQNVGHMGFFEAENEAAEVVNDFAKWVKSEHSTSS